MVVVLISQHWSTYFAQRDAHCKVVEGRVDNALAWAAYVDEVAKDGWGKLYVHAAPSTGTADDDDDGSFAMGYLEGLLTAERISQHFLSWCVRGKPEHIDVYVWRT